MKRSGRSFGGELRQRDSALKNSIIRISLATLAAHASADGVFSKDKEKKAADQSGRRRAQPVAQPNHAAAEHFVARKSHVFDRGRTGGDVAGVENTGSARAAIDDRTDDKAEFVD